MNKFTLNFGIIALALIVSFFSAEFIGKIYESLFTTGFGGDWIGDASAWQLVAGFPLALIFFLVLLFRLFGDQKNNKWLIWALALPVAFEVIFDLLHIYFPVALGLIAWGIAWVGRSFWKMLKH